MNNHNNSWSRRNNGRGADMEDKMNEIQDERTRSLLIESDSGIHGKSHFTPPTPTLSSPHSNTGLVQILKTSNTHSRHERTSNQPSSSINGRTSYSSSSLHNNNNINNNNNNNNNNINSTSSVINADNSADPDILAAWDAERENDAGLMDDITAQVTE